MQGKTNNLIRRLASGSLTWTYVMYVAHAQWLHYI